MKAVDPNWKPISWKGAPKGRDGTVAVSAGERVLMLVDKGDGRIAGGWYRPATDRWARAPSCDLPYRFRPAVAWTGEELLLWGGRNSGPTFFGDGARLLRNKWEVLAKKGAPTARAPHAIWTGRELIVWGGTGRKSMLNDGALYRPSEATWRPLDDRGAPSRREDACAIWTGRELWIYGGQNEHDDDFDGEPYGDGAAYDPATDRWRALPDLPKAAVRDPSLFVTSQGIVLLDTQRLRGWRIGQDGRKWTPLRIKGNSGLEHPENVYRVHDRLVVTSPLGMAVLDLASLQWLPVPKTPDLGSLDSITEVAHHGDLVFLDGKKQKGARLELYR